MIKFEFRGPEPPGHTHTPKTGYFHNKNLQGKSSSELLFTSKIFKGGNVPCFPQLGQVTYKIEAKNARF